MGFFAAFATNVAAAAKRLPSRGRSAKDGQLRTRTRAIEAPVSDCHEMPHSSQDSSPNGDDTDHSTETGPSSKDGGSSGSGSRASTEDRALEEIAFIKQHDTAEADYWYIVDARWLQEWKAFVSAQSAQKYGVPPKAISNSRLVDNNGCPRPGLKPVEHYRGVNGKVWEFWQKRYGGGPVILRRTIDIYSSPIDLRPGLETTGSINLYQDPHASAGSSAQPRDANQSSEAKYGVQRAVHSTSGHVSASTHEDEVQGESPDHRGTAALPLTTTRQERPSPKRSASGTLSGSQFCRSYQNSDGSSGSSPTAAQPPAKLCCDRCDGPHESDRCPHFRKPRDKHQDAWVNHGKGKKDEGGNDGAVIIRNARIVNQPPDGSCLFHSLSYGLSDRSTAFLLRKQISDFIARNPNMTIADTAISDWVHYDSGGTVQTYAERMATDPHQWGGGIEMAALTKMKHVNVHVYEKCNVGFRRISAFQCPGADKTVNVLYQGRMHYDALEVY
mmetsp:Transcript_26793/g.61769  ORF Transcript_26793/g.61769 Transcript_26793/m.61769 type:complete len:500 (+) Transcript_26793:71-1570(+)